MTGITEADLLAIFRAKVGKHGNPVKAFAVDACVHPSVIYRARKGEAPITVGMARALGYSRVISFIPITKPSDDRPDQGGPNGSVSRPACSEGEANG